MPEDRKTRLPTMCQSRNSRVRHRYQRGHYDIGSGIEDSQSSRKLTATVKGGEIVDDQWEERRLCHAEKPSQCKDTAKVLRGSHKHRHRAEGEHENRENDGRAEFLADEGHEWRGRDEGHEEDADDEVVLAIFEAEICAQAVGFGIT